MSDALRPTELRCEFHADPLGVDARKPRLSWLRASQQAGFHVQVASSRAALFAGEADLWDTAGMLRPRSQAV